MNTVSDVILHGTWIKWRPTEPGLFLVWGERRLAEASTKTRGRLLNHPYAVSSQTVKDALLAISESLMSGKFQRDISEGEAILTLPTAGKTPIPSRRILLELEGRHGMQDFRVDAAYLSTLDAVRLLSAIPISQQAESFVEIPCELGADVRFWSAAAKYIFHLISQHRFIPMLRAGEEDEFVALWEPALDEPSDAEKLRMLTGMMPDACRSVKSATINISSHKAQRTEKAECELPGIHPKQLTLDFLTDGVDEWVRNYAGRKLVSSISRGLKDDSMVEWLINLTTPAGRFRDPDLRSELKQLSKSLSDWRDASMGAGARPGEFRICFRLEPPQDETDKASKWSLRYFLQAVDDQSLLVPADVIWRERKATLRYLERELESPQERLLMGLGIAARMFSPIERSLRQARPESCPLGMEEAYQFLSEASLILQQSGFGVLAPPWWIGKKSPIKARLSVSMPRVEGPGFFSLDTIVQYDWQLALGDRLITREELERLAELKVPLVQMRGEWVLLRPEDIEAAMDFLKRYGEPKEMSLRDAVRLSLDESPELEGVEIDAIEAPGWLSSMVNDLKSGALKELKQPKGFVGKLRPYQLRGLSWLAFMKQWGLGACLADDMGLGKCLSGDSLIFVNGSIFKAEEIWKRYAEKPESDGEGFWVKPSMTLITNSIDEETGRIIQSPIRHLYRQRFHGKLRTVKLEDGSFINITYSHKLLTDKGWTNELKPGDYVCVPSKIVCEGKEVFYCRIKEIDEIKYDGWIYDFEVEKHHNFIANNILCHNTIQVIALLLNEKKMKKKETGPSLLVCPTSVVGNWQREAARFAPSLGVMIHHGSDRLAGEELAKSVMDHDLVVTSYGLARRDAKELAVVEWKGVILDEAQNIKNPVSKTAQAIRGFKSDFRFALTGTPVENRLIELWSIMEFLNPGYLGSRAGFHEQFVLPIERYGDDRSTRSLKSFVTPFILRRLKTDPKIISDLPEKLEMKVYCNLTREQVTLYEAIVKETMQQFEEDAQPSDMSSMQRRGKILSSLTKLKQLCNHPALFLHDRSELEGRSGKLQRLAEMLEEAIAEGDKALVFTQFTEMGEALQEYLASKFRYDVLFLQGSDSQKRRDRMVSLFQESPDGPPVFIISIRAGGTGLNLTRANHVFHFDRWWNPAVENQATDRAFRIGQTRNVQVHKFVCAGTLEEQIDQLIEKKKSLAESIIGSGEEWITELSNEDLRQLITLRRDDALSADER